jgi:esterase/lipase superfamily enzyme
MTKQRTPKTLEQIDSGIGMSHHMNPELVQALINGTMIEFAVNVFNNRPDSGLVQEVMIELEDEEFQLMIDEGQIDEDWWMRYENLKEEIRVEMHQAQEESYMRCGSDC